MGDPAGIIVEMIHRPESIPIELADLCLVTAVDIEFKTATDLLNSKIFSNDSKIKICQGLFANRRVTVLQCGMGARGFAEWLKNHLNECSYDALIVVGLAGGLDGALKAGDAVIYDRCYLGDSEPEPTGSKEKQSACDEKASIHCNDSLSRYLLDLLQASEHRSACGLGITVPRIITDAKDKVRFGADYMALAVDMESFHVLRVCADFGLPVSVLRVISDEVDDDLPDFNYASGNEGSFSNWRMFLAMTTRPAASLKFLLGMRAVMESLRTNLKTILSA